MMGGAGPAQGHQVAILNANYMAEALAPTTRCSTGAQRPRRPRVHPRPAPFKKSAGIEVDDIAKRLMDYGFHAPTMSGRSPAR
jgi:glycine dehydrogenase